MDRARRGSNGDGLVAAQEPGQRDADTLGTLEQNFGHRNFGVNAEIVESGLVNLDDKVELL
ncbi:MAG: hypothetical protein EBT13_01075 [Rhodobacteraceae bacterium]|nr:hypothetical protein [Paracoccaceae bacterium]